MRATGGSARRFNRIEHEILRCAAAGEAADFTDPRWRSADKAKPVVAGKFLSDLWLGLINDMIVHPKGIEIVGLRIEGPIKLDGARIDARLRSPLVGFSATKCEFPDAIDLSNAKVETVGFANCKFGRADHPRGQPAFSALSAEIIGQVMFISCRMRGGINLENAVVDDVVEMIKVVCDGLLFLDGSEIRGSVNIGQSRFIGKGGHSISAFDAVISGKIHISKCRLSGSVNLAHCRAVNVFVWSAILNGTLGERSLELTAARIDQNTFLRNCRTAASINASRMTAGGQIALVRCIVQTVSHEKPALDLSGCSSSSGIIIRSSRIRGVTTLRHAKAVEDVEFTKISFDPTGAAPLALHLGFLRAGSLNISGCRAGGQIRADDARMHNAQFHDSRIYWPAAGSGPDATDSYGCSLDLDRIHITGYLSITNCAFMSGVSIRDGAALGWVGITSCWVAPASDGWSLFLPSFQTNGIFGVSQSIFEGGVALPLLRCSELQFAGTRIGVVGKGTRPHHALWATEAVIERRLDFVLGGEAKHVGIANKTEGVVTFANSRFGENVVIRSVEMTLPDTIGEGESSRALDLEGANIGGSLILAPATNGQPMGIGRAERSASICGALALDKATVNGDVVIGGGTRILAAGEARRPGADGESQDLVRRCKRGVTISMLGARIGGSLDLAAAELGGIVDLREGDIGQIGDGCGERWEKMGVEAGNLLLDGLTYRDLDDLTEAKPPEPRWWRRWKAPPSRVERRLRWLALQYPKHQPCLETFLPEPYDQLARHFAQMGDERARRQVHIAKRDLQRRHGGLGWIERCIGGILSLTSHYGYSPGRAIFSTLWFVAAGSVLAWAISATGSFVPADADLSPAAHLSPTVYAVDAAIPFLDLGQESAWIIDVTKLPPWWRPDRVVPIGLALYQLAGAILLSITVLTLSGVLREKE